MNRTIVPRQLHEAALKTMKRLLDLGELAFGKETGAFRNYKLQTMAYISDMEIEQFSALETAGIVEPCGCDASLADGTRWARCAACAGSGFKDALTAPDATKEGDEDTR